MALTMKLIFKKSKAVIVISIFIIIMMIFNPTERELEKCFEHCFSRLLNRKLFYNQPLEILSILVTKMLH